MMEKRSDLIGVSPNPAQEPQKADDIDQRRQDYTQDPDGPNSAPGEEYLWITDGKHVLVGPKNGLPVLRLWRQMTGKDEMIGPYAHGMLEVVARWNAEWMIRDSNISLHLLDKMLRKYSKDMGWKYRAITDEGGMPFEGFKTGAVPGIGEINPGLKDWKNNEWSDTEQWDQNSQVDYYGEQDPTDDEPAPGPRVCSECGQGCPDYDSWRIHVERSHINPERRPSPMPMPVIDMDKPMPADFNTLIMDRTVQRQSASLEFVVSADTKPKAVLLKAVMPGVGEIGGLRIVNADTAPKSEGINVRPEYRRQGVATALWQEAQRRYPKLQHGDRYTDAGAAWVQSVNPDIKLIPLKQAAGQQIAGPIPFIYDIEEDRVYVGHPGERHSDIQGRFTPGGIVEGLYKPDGKVEIRTDTDMPYTVRHLIELWYAMHPELVVKQLLLLVGQEQYRLASSNIGNKVRNLAFTDPAVQEVYGALAHYGNVFVVGGAVRDVVLGKLPKDFDLMVQGVDAATLDAILRSLPGYVAESVDDEGNTQHVEGKAYGIFRYVTRDGYEVEVALPRTERSTGDSNADFQINSDPFLSVEQDLARRDFTANSMAVNLGTGELIDPYNGVQDTREGVLRTTNEDAFSEDPLRIVRALVAMSKHGFHLDPALGKMLKENAHRVKGIKEHRTYQELDKLFSGDDPARAMQAAYDLGIIHHLMPEAAAAHDFDQKSKYHRHLLHHHILDVLRRTAEQSPDKDLRLAAFLHDIGKPASQWIDDDGFGHYYYDKEGDRGAQHADVGAEMADATLRRLNYPRKRIQRVKHLIQHHMFPPFSGPNGAKKFLKNVGSQHAFDLLKLRRADGGGKGINEFENTVPVELQEQLVTNILHHKEPYSLKDLAVNGHDLLNAGIPEGPQMGQILNQLADAVLENPALNTPETLMALAQQWNAYNQQPTHMPHTVDAEGAPLAEPTEKQASSEYEIRPADEGYFEHEEGQWRPRYYQVKDKASGEMVQADRLQTKHGQGSGVVAYHQGQPVGSLTWQENPSDVMLGSAYVQPDHRQRGLFTQMYQHLPQGKPVDAYVWDNPMLKNKVRDWQRTAAFNPDRMVDCPDCGDRLSMPDEARCPSCGFGDDPRQYERLDPQFWEYVTIHNRADRDDGEHQDIPDEEMKRLHDEYLLLSIDKRPKRANILDPIHEELDPDVFDNHDQHAPSVKPRIVRWIKEHVYKIMRENAWADPQQYLTMVLTGSLTTYQWSHHSDFDVSLWIDSKMFPTWARADLIRLMVEQMDGTVVPGTTHPIQCYVVPPHVRREQLYKPGLRSGYDLDTQQWIVKPEHNRTVDVERDMPNLIQLCNWVEDKMRLLLTYHPDAAKIFWDAIHHARQRDMRAGKGDYAESNVIYKFLANRGIFPWISDVTGEYIASARMESHGWSEPHTSAEEAEGTEGEEAPSAEGVWSSPAPSGSQPDPGDAGAAEHVGYQWPTAEGVLALGQIAVDNWQGVRDPGLVDAAIGATQNQYHYGGVNDAFELAAHFINNIQRQQGIVEGNKRTAVATGIAFLMDNGYPEAYNLLQDEPLPMGEMMDSDLLFSRQVVAMAEGNETPEQLAAYMRRHVMYWRQQESGHV